ncbi:hypothetical protein SISSUDRAFT_79691 [Sistotremastrum suecicum HHB10207 ss-3]|uniref:AMP-dependent synthetase/ligase domain-containing protein n=1 Tax=Sistotremastrum suecicum HHB10207 ss-3 TaxID=1314776 RepID=A0A166H439_9AGAM|nr:hypothetical protein SISSUDRAFT_79691 [Sistotremastrum suecicum HHB10207 ss-3]
MTKTGCDVLIGSIPDEEGGRGSALEITTERLVESLDVDITLIPIPDIFDFLPSLNPSLTPIPSHSSNSSSPSPSPSTDASVAGDREDAIERLPPIPYPQCQSWTSIIIHSSGSTSFPKPISFPQKHTLQWSHFTWFGEQDLGTPSPAPILRQKDTGDSVGDFVAAAGVDGAKSTGRGEKGADGGNGGGEVDEGWSGGEVTSSGMSLPGFHAIGVGCQIGVPFTTGAVVSYFLPTHHKTPVPLTAPNVLAGMVNTGVRYSFGLPTHFEEWSNSVECMDKLLPQKGM